MFKKFKTKELVFIAILGAIVFAFDILFITSIEAIVGIPGIGVMVDTIFVVALGTLGGLVVRKFGVYTGWALVYSILAIPTNIMGPPGAYKIFIGLTLGIVADIILLLFKYKKIGYYLALAIANTLSIPTMLFFLIQLGLPGAQELIKAIGIFIPIILVESLAGAWLGILLFNKLKTKQIIKQLST